MLNPYNILFPDPKNPANLLKHKDGPLKDTPEFVNLFDSYQQFTITDVANSNKYYAKYVTFPVVVPTGSTKTTTGTFARELAWSYSHFREHVESGLYESVNSEFPHFKTEQQGGLLFLKLLLNKLVINNKSSLENLVTTVVYYDIKKENPSENIFEVVLPLAAATRTIINLQDDKEYPLPEKFVQKMLKVMQTTSVPGFNSNFKTLEDQLTFNRCLKATLNSPLLLMNSAQLQITTPTNNFTLDNTLTNAELLWTFAASTYQELNTSGKWQLAVQPPIKQVNTANTDTGHSQIECWNCNETGHHARNCPKPINQANLEKNRSEFLKAKRKAKSRGEAGGD